MKRFIISRIAFPLLAIVCLSVSLSAQQKTEKKNIGIQLFSARTLMTDVPAALEYISNLGFTTLETYGYNNGKLFGVDAKEFVNIASKYGLTVTSAHLRTPYNSEDLAATMKQWEQIMDEHVALGFKYIVIASHNFGNTEETLNQSCEYFNAVGKMAKDKGLILCYHNRNTDMTLVDGTPILEYVIQHTNPAYVFFELDVLWTTEGGQDPKAFLKKYPDRIILLHLSDKDVTGASGEIDIEGIVKQFYANGKTDFYVEIERLGDHTAEEALKLSADYLINSSVVK